MVENDIGRSVVDTIYKHPELQNTEIIDLAVQLGQAMGVALGVQVREGFDDDFINTVREVAIKNFEINFNNQIMKGKNK